MADKNQLSDLQKLQQEEKATAGAPKAKVKK